MSTPTKTFDPTKPCRTRDGRSARVVCTDAKDDLRRTIIALITEHNGNETLGWYLPNGRLWDCEDGPDDLINLPERHVRWVNIYRTTGGDSIYGSVYQTREGADSYMGTNRIACIRIEFEEGEGL